MIYLFVFFILVDYYFQAFLQIKVNFVRSKNNLKTSWLNSVKYHELKYRNCFGKLV